MTKDLFKGKQLGVIGTGNMGTALLKGIVDSGLIGGHRIAAADRDPKRLRTLKQQVKVITDTDNQRVARDADIVLLCVKPQTMDAVLEDIRPVADRETLFISIAAGVPTKRIEKLLGRVPVVRVMPNTPAMIGEGMSALCRGKHAGATDMARAEALCAVAGKTLVVPERLMDAVTGLSGSGPAYVYTVIEGLAEGGVQAGLTRKQAETLAVQTLIGASRLAGQSKETPAELRDRVTSPGGTTLAGLKAMNIDRFKKILQKTVEAATKRSRELGKQS